MAPHKLTDGRSITETRAAALTVDHLRRLVRWCDNQNESWWLPDGPPLTVAMILKCYHVANDAGYAGMDEWHSEERIAAIRAWSRITGRL